MAQARRLRSVRHWYRTGRVLDGGCSTAEGAKQRSFEPPADCSKRPIAARACQGSEAAMSDKRNFVLIPDDAPPIIPAPRGGILAPLRAMATTGGAADATTA